jgi:hypothetical protein
MGRVAIVHATDWSVADWPPPSAEHLVHAAWAVASPGACGGGVTGRARDNLATVTLYRLALESNRAFAARHGCDATSQTREKEGHQLINPVRRHDFFIARFKLQFKRVRRFATWFRIVVALGILEARAEEHAELFPCSDSSFTVCLLRTPTASVGAARTVGC